MARTSAAPLSPILKFRPPVILTEPVVAGLCFLARDGYETPRKRETFGFLYGTLAGSGRLEIRRAVPYRGGRRTRTGVQLIGLPAIIRMVSRREALARVFGMRFLGGFHSHVEIAGRVFRGLSDSDRRSLLTDSRAALEAVVFVWAGGSHRASPPAGSIAVHEASTGYSYRVRVYAKRPAGIRATRVRLPDGGRSLLLP